MKITEVLAFATGAVIFLLGLGIAVVFILISLHQKSIELLAIGIGLLMLAAGWILTKYAVKSTGKSILHILLELF
jgi:hypothetical protein